jgi:uncharacterized protein (DUF2236 family)
MAASGSDRRGFFGPCGSLALVPPASGEYVAPVALPFSPGTITHRVNLEPVIFLGGGRALLLQVAHPLVAAGVAQHSDYERDPWSRLSRTLDVMMKMAFGDPAVSERQTRALEARHRLVVGTSADGVPYRATDPALLVWVWATLVDTALTVYERCYGPISALDRERYYQEQKLLARGCGVPPGACPVGWDDFRAYLRDMVAGELRVTPEARAVASAITGPVLRWPLGPAAAAPLRLLTAGLLPPSLRQAYGLPWSSRQERALDMSLTGLGVVTGALPRRLRSMPSMAMVRSSRPVAPPRFLQRAPTPVSSRIPRGAGLVRADRGTRAG